MFLSSSMKISPWKWYTFLTPSDSSASKSACSKETPAQGQERSWEADSHPVFLASLVTQPGGETPLVRWEAWEGKGFPSAREFYGPRPWGCRADDVLTFTSTLQIKPSLAYEKRIFLTEQLPERGIHIWNPSLTEPVGSGLPSAS